MLEFSFKLFLESEQIMNSPKLKLFGADAHRVTNDELNTVVEELRRLIGSSFSHFVPVPSLKEKMDHGDIDILVAPSLDIHQLLIQKLGSKLIKFSKNDTVNSFLFHSEKLQKLIHIDLIASATPEQLETKKYYYALNDFSALIGVLSKKLNFKYGTEGFFKRFQDKKGNWHDILITNNLLQGLELLGLDVSKYSSIKNYNDIVNFLLTSPLLDSKYFGYDALLARDRVSISRRPNLSKMIELVKDSAGPAKIKDEDYFFKKIMPSQYQKVQQEMQKINEKTYELSNKYNGSWLMSTFGIKPGPELGKILKSMSDHFKENLPNANEQDVINFVKNLGAR